MKKTLILSAALALAGVAPAAFAHDAAGFIRGEIGRSTLDFDGIGEETDTAAMFGGGYWFNPNVAIEGHIGSLYNEKFTDEFGDEYDVDVISVGLGVAAKKNFGAEGNGFFVGGRAGIARVTGQVRVDFDVQDDESDTGAYFGANVGYDFNDRFGVSLNWDRRQADLGGIDVDIDTIALGGEFRF